MPKTIIADTSCFIILANIGEIELLKALYGTVLTTNEVEAEYGEPFPGWVEIKSPADKTLQHVIEMEVDKGEASAIALAVEITGSILIVDDYKARRVAEKLELTITGTLGVIIKAKLSGIIPGIKPYLNKMKETGFYLSDEIIKQALKESGE